MENLRGAKNSAIKKKSKKTSAIKINSILMQNLKKSKLMQEINDEQNIKILNMTGLHSTSILPFFLFFWSV